MESRAKLAGHAIHPMLIVFPLGLFAMAVVFDVITVATQNSRFSEAAFYMIAAGIVTGLMAAVFGLVDYVAIPQGTRAKSVAIWHAIGNVCVIGLFVSSFALRWQGPSQPTLIAIMLALGGASLATITGWLGGELVERHGIGIDDHAGLNAPSSLQSPS